MFKRLPSLLDAWRKHSTTAAGALMIALNGAGGSTPPDLTPGPWHNTNIHPVQPGQRYIISDREITIIPIKDAYGGARGGGKTVTKNINTKGERFFLTEKILSETVTTEGYLSAYAERPSVATIAYRMEISRQLPSWARDEGAIDVFIAVPNCDLIGAVGTLTVEGEQYTAMVFDCAGADGSHSWMKTNNLIAEVDWWFWQDHPTCIGKTLARLELYDYWWNGFVIKKEQNS